MTKLFLPILIIFSLSVCAQKTETSKEDTDAADSKDKQTSYFKVGAGVGNQLLSIHNKALNAGQNLNTIIFTPSIGYYHKSGFGISFEGYLLKDSGSTNFYQSSLTPSYEYDGKDISAGVSYSRYFVKNKYGGSTSPIQNDFYANVVMRKHAIHPGLAVGYSSGTYKEIDLVTINFPQIGPRTFPDTVTTKTTAFSLIGSLEHTFDFANVLSPKGELSFTPAFMANAGSAKFVVTHANRFNVTNTGTVRRKGKVRGSATGESSKQSFTLQSVGANFDVMYTIGKFSLEPQLYLDYYLLQSDTKAFTQVYNIILSVSF